MGNLHCSAKNPQKTLKNPDKILINPSKPPEIIEKAVIFGVFPKKNTLKIKRDIINRFEIEESLKFQQNYDIFHQFLDLNPTITSPKLFHIECSKFQKTLNFPKFSLKTPIKPRETSRKNLEISLKNPEFPRKSFKELFQNDDSLYLAIKKPSKMMESLKKSVLETHSTPYFDKTNELLDYLPKNPSFSSEFSVEKPRELAIQQTKLDSLHFSPDLSAKTLKEFSIESSEYEESEEIQQIYINLFDLLQNQLKTRRNSFSPIETPKNPSQKQEKFQKNDSQTSFKTLKKNDFLSPLPKNTQKIHKETLNLSMKKPAF